MRFLAWDETLLPTPHASLVLASPVDLTFVPHFEYRDVYGWASVANGIGARFHQTSQPYLSTPGMVHTSYRMFPHAGTNCSTQNGCPPADLFKSNNEWFWPRDDGKAYGAFSFREPPIYGRQHGRPQLSHGRFAGQLCFSNASLVSYLAERAASMLADAATTQPSANVISISQNDNGNCERPSVTAVVLPPWPSHFHARPRLLFTHLPSSLTNRGLLQTASRRRNSR